MTFLSGRLIVSDRTIRGVDDFGRYGIWISRKHWPENAGQVASAAQELESLGFGSVWIGGSPPDDLLLPPRPRPARPRRRLRPTGSEWAP